MVRKGPLIYLLTFPNGKQYVGQTVGTFEARMTGHKSSAVSDKKKGCRLLRLAIRKYGWANITKEILLYCDEDMLDHYEDKFISSYGTLCPGGYNLITGGNSNKHMSDSTKKVMSEAARKRDSTVYRKSEETRDLPRFMLKITTQYMKGYKIMKHPHCSSKHFCSSEKSDEENLLEALKFLEDLNSGKVSVIHNPRTLPEGIQRSGNGYRVFWKNSLGKRFIKHFNTGDDTREDHLRNAVNHLNMLKRVELKSQLDDVKVKLQLTLESYARQAKILDSIEEQIEKLRTMFND